jgi:hypothetical protein
MLIEIKSGIPRVSRFIVFLAAGTGRGMIFEQVLIFIRDHNFTIRNTKKWWTDQKGAATILSDGLVVSSWSCFMCFSAKYTLSPDKTEDNIDDIVSIISIIVRIRI